MIVLARGWAHGHRSPISVSDQRRDRDSVPVKVDRGIWPAAPAGRAPERMAAEFSVPFRRVPGRTVAASSARHALVRMAAALRVRCQRDLDRAVGGPSDPHVPDRMAAESSGRFLIGPATGRAIGTILTLTRTTSRTLITTASTTTSSTTARQLTTTG